MVWSGQHWDPALTTTFFAQYGLPRPHHLLKGVGGEPRGRRIGRMVSALSDHLAARPPAAVLVQGDTNTAAAGALAAHCAGIPVVHVEAGLRSFDPGMPEEANRRLIAPLADEAVGERLAQLPSPYGDGRASAEIVAAVRSRYLAPEPRTEQHTEQRPEPDRTPVAAAATGVGGHR
ncbi:UDP-N-acetylglucosamine 2-epimerase [Kitasatospora sp. NPDC056800]|uniref:UDP-N-acetylglucosamine 2-epimerase n=1 Tax=Kitasatospora sp. NPDC056800 TaxID=3345948 RepID=UPI0036BC89E6